MLDGKLAIVTGAGRGIGRALALRLAEEGATVAVWARTAAEVETTAKVIRASGGRAHAYLVDVADPGAVRAGLHCTESELGPVAVLINNAGIQGAIGPLWENDPDSWWATVKTNLGGMFHCCRMVLPGMVERQQGKIINLSGGGATSPRPNFSAYATSKAAIVRLTETLAEEVKPYNIQVNAVAPGAINTRMLEEILAVGENRVGMAEMAAASYRAQQGGDSLAHVLELVTFLASDASGALTGKLISAVHDPWHEWAGKADELNASPLYTLRRLDPHTIKPLLGAITES